MMNYAPNEIRWKIGDLVSHDADDKCEAMLMRVTGYAADGRFKIFYARATKMNGDSGRRHPARWENPLTHLHDPARFGLGKQARKDGSR